MDQLAILRHKAGQSKEVLEFMETEEGRMNSVSFDGDSVTGNNYCIGYLVREMCGDRLEFGFTFTFDQNNNITYFSGPNYKRCF